MRSSLSESHDFVQPIFPLLLCKMPPKQPDVVVILEYAVANILSSVSRLHRFHVDFGVVRKG
jgi:hypothetical protein